MKTLERKMLNAKQVSEAYGVPQGTLAQWRHMKKGPKYFKVPEGRKVLYKVQDLDFFFLGNPVLTSDSVQAHERA